MTIRSCQMKSSTAEALLTFSGTYANRRLGQHSSRAAVVPTGTGDEIITFFASACLTNSATFISSVVASQTQTSGTDESILTVRTASANGDSPRTMSSAMTSPYPASATAEASYLAFSPARSASQTSVLTHR